MKQLVPAPMDHNVPGSANEALDAAAAMLHCKQPHRPNTIDFPLGQLMR
jgi:hypothetical protein